MAVINYIPKKVSGKYDAVCTGCLFNAIGKCKHPNKKSADFIKYCTQVSEDGTFIFIHSIKSILKKL